jgi:hypothetical protein
MSDRFFEPDDPADDVLPAVPEAAPAGGRGRRSVGAVKTPPHSIEAEQSVLGGLMLNNDAWFNVAEVVSGRDFYRPGHQIIYEAMADLAADDQPWTW